MTRKIFIFFLLLSGTALAQDIRLSAKADADTFQLGSWIDIHVTGKLGTSVDTIAPFIKDSIGLFEVISVERPSSDPAWLIRLTTIDSGKIYLPPIEFAFKNKNDTAVYKAFTNHLTLNITGVKVDTAGDIKDIKPPMMAPWLFEDFLPYLIALGVIAVIAGCIYYYLRRKKQKEMIKTEVKIIIPPHKEALAALHLLEEKKLWQQGMVKQYYSEVTEIIRRFFERRWNIIALEMTTYEIFIQMKPIPEALNIWNEMESFFTTADLVKFAKYVPSDDEHQNEMRTAYDIVHAMMPKITPEQETAPQEVTADVR